MDLHDGPDYDDSDEQEAARHRIQLVRILKDIRRWDPIPHLANAVIACPVCGALVHQNFRLTHIAWHERNNQ